MFQFEIYILRAAHALGCARSFCYQMIFRIAILNDSKTELSMAVTLFQGWNNNYKKVKN